MDTCELCHDGTGGQGVYGVVAARGLTVGAAHRTEQTAAIPGGDESTGETVTATFRGLGGTLTCDDCHSPHGANLVEPFTTDRRRSATGTADVPSSKLLKRRPTGATTETVAYGSDWCGGCHRGRLSGNHDVINHPVDSAVAAGSSSFTFESVQRVRGVDSSETEAGSLAGSNFGYVMPWPRTSGQGTHGPVCQQCHEDGRRVGDTKAGLVSADETFTVTGSDGANAGDNPRFQVFPHESPNQSLLVESGDDLCTNCHPEEQLE